MALLSRTWFIIETVLIRDGFGGWYCLSFFIHPLLLVLCQIFIWIENLIVQLKILVFKFIWHVILRAFMLLRDFMVRMLCLGGSEDFPVKQDNIARYEVPDTASLVQTIVLHDCCRVLLNMGEKEEDRTMGEKEDTVDRVNGIEEEEEEEENKEEESSVDFNEGCSTDESSSSIGCSSFESPIREREAQNDREEVEIDEFYHKYIERMAWFDLLNYERTCGMSAILNEQLETQGFLGSTEYKSFSFPYNRWSKMAKRKLMRSLESEFERVYVGQSCLCWEALHHQYRKVEALASSASVGGAFYDNVSGKFQQFHVVLERYLENETTKQKRYWNYVRGRFSTKILLQVPEISGLVEQEKGWKSDNVFARELMKIIEKSIRTFWVFLKKDNEMSSWDLGSLFWEHSQVEDPKDLEQLAELTKTLQKKELGMKNVLRRKGCWLKRANPLDESQKLEVLFSMIEMKLVSRVLKMNEISTHQLQWCQEKLSRITFKDERVVRACISCLFPRS